MHRRRDGRRGPLRGGLSGASPPISALEETRELLRLAIPIAIAQLGLVAMGLVETAVLGRVSVDDLAGAGIGRSIGFATTVIAIGMSTGLEPVASQAVGARDLRRAWQGYVVNVKATLLLWAPLVALAFAITATLGPLGVSPAVVSRVRLYLAGQAPGFVAMLAFFSTKTYLQANGRTAPALVASVVANVINLFAANLLVRGDAALVAVGLAPRGMPALGALGGGLAFTLSCVVLLACVAPAAWRLRAAAMRAESPRPPVTFRETYALGVPVGLQMAAEVGIFSLVALLSGALGAEVASAHQIAIGLASFTFMGALGVSGATAVRVGHAIGAGTSPRRAGALGIALGACTMAFGAVVFAVAPRLLVEIFTGDARVIAVGIRLVRIAALFQLFDGVQTVSAGALRGAGDVRFPFVANVVAHWGVGFPVALALGFGLGGGAPGLWWGLTAGLVAVSVVLAGRFAVVSSRVVVAT